jgi:hypothetical protein
MIALVYCISVHLTSQSLIWPALKACGAPLPVSQARVLGLAHLGEDCASGDEGSLVEGKGVDDSCVGC